MEIIDLDRTLVDAGSLALLGATRRWSEVSYDEGESWSR